MKELDLTNQQFRDALNIIENTQNSLFLTGKAGTGKSTFLRHISQTTKKKHVILAPTGIAAINAGGQTLHSFFKIPFHPLVPDDVQYSPRNIRETLKYNAEKIKLIRELDLIIIDEISMVRGDIIDFIDKVLRVYSRNMRVPFGGKQMLLVGDVFQLEPVLKEDDRRLLQPFYTSGYFFAARIWREMQLVSIELTKVYRQRDGNFIALLDRIRESQATEADIKTINTRVGKIGTTFDSTSKNDDDNDEDNEDDDENNNVSSSRSESESINNSDDIVITLSTRRDSVDYINQERLQALSGKPQIYTGHIRGDFPDTMLPTLVDLELKVGAQVIFVKNDQEKRWVNGTLGIITALGDDDIITVRTEDGTEWDVERACWSNVRYTFNETEKKIEEEELGTFTQFPLRLAWAITVHKSQGLTFNNVNIDFHGGAFAGGQTYVALSRCRSLEGITLQEPLALRDVFVRQEVKNFARQYNDQRAIDTALKRSKADREYEACIMAFDQGDMQQALDHFFVAIHARYDIEKPAPRRLIRRKLDIVNRLREEQREKERQHARQLRQKEQQHAKEVKALQDKLNEQQEFLKKLATEYVIMGKECEREGMPTAAIANYQKALHLCPTLPDAQRRLKKLEKKP